MLVLSQWAPTMVTGSSLAALGGSKRAMMDVWAHEWGNAWTEMRSRTSFGASAT